MQVIANLAFLFPAAGMIGLSFLLTPELQVLPWTDGEDDGATMHCKDEIFWFPIWSFLGGCSCGLGVHLFLQWGHNVQLYTEPHQPCTKQVSAWSWSFHCFHQVGNTLWDLERIWKHNRIPGARDKETDCLGKLPDVDFESWKLWMMDNFRMRAAWQNGGGCLSWLVHSIVQKQQFSPFLPRTPFRQ